MIERLKEFFKESGETRVLWTIIVILLLLRLLTLGYAPLFDSTEGRYAEIGRKMARSGDFVTPRLDGNMPFLGKPPLHFWMTALSFKALGYDEFAARLPGFLSLLLMLAMTGMLARRLYGMGVAAWSVLVLLTSALVFIGSACVMTDMTLAATFTGAMACLILALDPKTASPRGWSYGFFAFMGLGVLAKGPVAVALGILTVVPALYWTGRLRALRRLPWGGGLVLATLIALPWYIMAEQRNPGFLKYFILNEHFLRFLKRDFGEQRGSLGHTYFYGSIWGMGLAGFLPWSPLLLLAAWRAARARLWRSLAGQERVALLLAWALAPLVLFTLARNIMMAYVLPGLPGLAMLTGLLLSPWDDPAHASAQSASRVPQSTIDLIPRSALVFQLTAWSGIVFGSVMIVIFGLKGHLPLSAMNVGLGLLGLSMIFLVHRGPQLKRMGLVLSAAALFPCIGLFFSYWLGEPLGHTHSTRHLITVIKNDPQLAGRAVVFFKRIPYSAQFYLATEGVFRLIGDPDGEQKLLHENGILIVDEMEARHLPPGFAAAFEMVQECEGYRIWAPRESTTHLVEQLK